MAGHAVRRVLVTGAGSGIGRGVASFLASKGHHVYVTDLNIDPAMAVVDEIVAKGGSASAHQLDAGNVESIESVIRGLQEKPNVLVNNAGIQHVSTLEEFPMDKWQKLVDVMLVGVAALTKAVLPTMRDEGYGRVINIGSVHSLVGSPGKSAYVAAKHGLIGFSKVMALETGNSNITVNTLCPAYVRTPLVENQVADQAKLHGISEEEVIKNIMLRPMPKGRFIEVEELAGTCDFLMSDYARNITAQAIALDGGWTAQ
ncbi:short chain dehydrogenase [Salpingoeca rosetta]|uniref:3-oxoacyl-[acyl-carrier-protein] reductase n=1 Tax=Salpingoeca rosetta (strain ATCC 50818 / BSB-021) TaxID=946362 RepID=F2UN60_SALR5|nr:short chain dehydrogenase [Salpingoeca rosetta]EGD78559.1 short chain dehydrogenase [Salpingoeca rosetta]|eukprot:XP_004989508.1 short chain dehydrogenase [Salpingoeca rosetta]